MKISAWPSSVWMLRPEIPSSTGPRISFGWSESLPGHFVPEKRMRLLKTHAKWVLKPVSPRCDRSEDYLFPMRRFGGQRVAPVLDPDPHCQTQRSLPSRSISTPFRPGCLNYDRPDPDTSALESGILGRPGLCSTALGVDAATPRCHRDILQWICTRGQRKP